MNPWTLAVQSVSAGAREMTAKRSDEQREQDKRKRFSAIANQAQSAKLAKALHELDKRIDRVVRSHPGIRSCDMHVAIPDVPAKKLRKRLLDRANDQTLRREGTRRAFRYYPT